MERLWLKARNGRPAIYAGANVRGRQYWLVRGWRTPTGREGKRIRAFPSWEEARDFLLNSLEVSSCPTGPELAAALT
jgi:hypothetical protein